MDKITVRQGYVAMFLFLERLYGTTRADELGSLLGDLALLEDGNPADPAAWDDWLAAVAKARNSEDGAKFHLEKP